MWCDVQSNSAWETAQANWSVLLFFFFFFFFSVFVPIATDARLIVLVVGHVVFFFSHKNSNMTERERERERER